VVDFIGMDQVLALAAADIDSVPFVAVERGAGDSQRLALDAGFLDPVVTPAGSVGAVAHLRDHALQPDLAGVREHLFAIDLKAFAELETRLSWR
jgi:hypothetical protein